MILFFMLDGMEREAMNLQSVGVAVTSLGFAQVAVPKWWPICRGEGKKKIPSSKFSHTHRAL